MDLLTKFSQDVRPYDKFTVIIVVTVGVRIVGLVVDALSDVLDIPPREVRPTPELGRREDTRFLSGMATVGDKLIVLLDIDTWPRSLRPAQTKSKRRWKMNWFKNAKTGTKLMLGFSLLAALLGFVGY